MAETPIPITTGSGSASVASDLVSGASYQQIKLVDGTIGSNTALIVNSDGTLNARISGSVATAGGTFAGSISGTVGSSIIGTVPVTQSTTPWIITGSVQGSFTAAANQSVSGTVGASVIGVVPVNIVSGGTTGSVSGTVGASIIGQLPAGTAMLGSIAAYQGAAPFIVNFQNSSIIAIQSGSVVSLSVGSVISLIQGSVAAVQSGTRSTSIAGGYATGAGSVISGLGILVLGVRNDTMASVFGADGAYSPLSVGPTGENIVANAPINKWVQGQSSVFTTSSQVALAKSGASIFTYVTAVQVANMSANNVLVTFAGGTASILGFTIAPANGGSNIILPNAWKTAANQDFTASISGGVASVYISAEGFISKT